MNIELIIGVIVGIITLVGVIYQIRETNKKIKSFKGRIGKDVEDGKKTKKFTDFIYKNEGKIIHLDIYFDNDKNYKIDKDGLFHFSYYYDLNKKNEGGYEYLIKVNENDDFYYDDRISSKRLVGNFKIIGFSGPKQGWMSTFMKPVKIEAIK